MPQLHQGNMTNSCGTMWDVGGIISRPKRTGIKSCNVTLKSVSNLKSSTQVSKQASGRRFPNRPHRTPRNITTSSSHNTNFKNDNSREPFNDPAPKTSKNKISDSSETLHISSSRPRCLLFCLWDLPQLLRGDCHMLPY